MKRWTEYKKENYWKTLKKQFMNNSYFDNPSQRGEKKENSFVLSSNHIIIKDKHRKIYFLWRWILNVEIILKQKNIDGGHLCAFVIILSIAVTECQTIYFLIYPLNIMFIEMRNNARLWNAMQSFELLCLYFGYEKIML